MALSDDQKKFYDQLRERTRREIEDISNDIEQELAAVKEKITRLNAEKQAARQIYDGACLRLGVENDLAKIEEENGTLTDE